MQISLLELRRLRMFKKIFAIATLVGVALFASVSGASAHQNGYKKHYHGPAYGWNKGIPLHVIRKKLRHRGFYKIRFVDRYLPVYKAKVCKRGKRFKLRINRWGEVMARKRIGWCGYGYGHYHRHHSKW